MLDLLTRLTSRTASVICSRLLLRSAMMAALSAERNAGRWSLSKPGGAGTKK